MAWLVRRVSASTGVAGTWRPGWSDAGTLLGMGGKERLPARWGGSSANELQRRIDAVPDWIRPAFSEFRYYVHDQAVAYQESNSRPSRRTLRRYLAGFLRGIRTHSRSPSGGGGRRLLLAAA